MKMVKVVSMAYDPVQDNISLWSLTRHLLPAGYATEYKVDEWTKGVPGTKLFVFHPDKAIGWPGKHCNAFFDCEVSDDVEPICTDGPVWHSVSTHADKGWRDGHIRKLEPGHDIVGFTSSSWRVYLAESVKLTQLTKAILFGRCYHYPKIDDLKSAFREH